MGREVKKRGWGPSVSASWQHSTAHTCGIVQGTHYAKPLRLSSMELVHPLNQGLGRPSFRLPVEISTRVSASLNSDASSSQMHQAGASAGRQDVRTASFPGATGPGTGARHYPPLKADISRPLKGKERKETFEMKTTKDYYKEFPGLIRSSFPLYIKSAGVQEPLGKLEQALQDAGPETGQRKMPEAVDREGRLRPRMPFHPDTDRDDLLRERDTRHL